MAITDEEKSLLKKEILDEIKASSQGVLELEKVTALSGVNSLPAMQGTKVVLVPLPLLSKPAEDAAAVALAAASEAADATAETEDVADVTRELAKEMAAATAQTKSATAAAEGIVAEFNAVAETALGGTSLFNVNARCGDATYTLETALQALAAQEMNDGVTYRKKGLVVTYRIDAAKWETRQFIGATLDDWTQEALWQGFGSGSGAGNVYNVTALLPLDSGYYTLATALAAVAREKGQARGLVLTFAVSDGEWQSYQFIGATLDGWNDTAQWREFGSGVRSVTVNGGGKMQPDGDGNVDIPVPTVDDSLDAESTNPVENAAVARRLNEIDASTVFGMTADLNDDESSVRLSLTNKSGAEIAGVDIPAGGGGGGESVTTKIVLSAGVDHPVVKEGGSVRLTYTYDHQYAAGDDAGTTTGQKATIRITASRGSVEAFGETVQDVSKGSYTLDLTPYLQAGVTDIYVRATTTDPETGRQQSKQAYVSVRAVAFEQLQPRGGTRCGRLRSGGYGRDPLHGERFGYEGRHALRGRPPVRYGDGHQVGHDERELLASDVGPFCRPAYRPNGRGGRCERRVVAAFGERLPRPAAARCRRCVHRYDAPLRRRPHLHRRAPVASPERGPLRATRLRFRGLRSGADPGGGLDLRE